MIKSVISMVLNAKTMEKYATVRFIMEIQIFRTRLTFRGNMAKYISIPREMVEYLDKKCPKDEEGRREETYSETIKRLIKKYEVK